MSVINVTDAQLAELYPSMRPAPAPPADATPLQRMYPNSPADLFEPEPLPRNLEPALGAMYPSCERLNREDQERAYLRQAAPDLSQRDRWRLAEALAEMPHERRLALIGKERAQAVELLKGRPTAGSTRVRTR